MFALVELLGRYSNQNIVTRLRQVLAGHGRDDPPVRPTRPRQTQRRLSTDEIDDLVKRRLAGMLIDALATEFDVNRTTVMKHLADHPAVPSRSRNVAQRTEL